MKRVFHNVQLCEPEQALTKIIPPIEYNENCKSETLKTSNGQKLVLKDRNQSLKF